MGRKLKFLSVVLVVLVLVGVGGYFVFEKPRVRSVDVGWGEVTQNYTEVELSFRLNNPNPVGVELGFVELSSDVFMNGIEMGGGYKESVRLEEGLQTFNHSIYINNSLVDEWWVSHLRNGEESVVVVSPEVVFDLGFGSFRFDLPNWSKSIETDVLGRLEGDVGMDVGVGNSTLLVVEDFSARWGEIGDEESVVVGEVVLRNPNGFSIPLNELDLGFRVNDVLVGSGSTGGVVVGEGREVVGVDVVLDNSLFDEWWVSHLRGGGRSSVCVDVGVVVEFWGEEFELDVGEFNSSFRTDFF